MSSDFMIIESLSVDDEKNDRFEGRFLKKYLKLCGFDPEYYYVRTKKELSFVSESIRSTQRTLFISCHGGENNICTTLEKVTFEAFAEIFSGKLNNKRVLGSFCLAGREKFAKALYKKNPDMSCFIAPTEVVYFQSTYPFWATFVSILLSSDKKATKKLLTKILSVCSHIFSMKMAYYPKKFGQGAMDPLIFDPQTIDDNDCNYYKELIEDIN